MNTIEAQPLLEPGTLGQWIAERSGIWQMKFMNPSELDSLAKEREVRIWAEHIVYLWQLRLLRADLVISKRRLRIAGLISLGRDEDGQLLYADGRRAHRRTQGWLSAVAKLPPLPSDVELVFHPFRFYVLYQLQRVSHVPIHPLQAFLASKGYLRLAQDLIENYRQWTASPDFVPLVSHWNDVASLAIASEPCAYERIFGQFIMPGGIDEKIQRERIAQHWEDLAPVYQRLGAEAARKVCDELCLEAYRLDPNEDIQTLLRLVEGQSRLRITGHTGGAVYLRTMAEMVRRAAEQALSIELPEEDEYRSGPVRRVVKQQLYGSSRLLDGDRRSANEFVRDFGLDYGTRVHWYVEGDTEWHALDSILGKSGWRGIEIFNLRGRVQQKGGLAFRDNLRADLRAGIFSFVSVDGDRSDNARAVRKAAEDDEIHGRFLISQPDFEFENFTLMELEEVLWGIAHENHAAGADREKLHRAIETASSATALLAAARRALPELREIAKGPEWGKRLMAYAMNHPELPDGKQRPIVEMMISALKCVRLVDYHLTKTRFRVDPNTGKSIERDTASSGVASPASEAGA
jgi:hypothetical protein